MKKQIITKIRKRDGRIVKFDQDKITQAIYKTIMAVDEKDGKKASELSDKVLTILDYQFDPKTIPTVEEIQDIVEKVLIKAGLDKVAKAYILYRKEHEKMREMGGILMDVQKLMDGYLKQKDWRVKENANIGYSFGGLMLHISGSVIANYILENIYPKKISQAHKNGDLHLHDLYMGLNGYCAGWSLRQLLLEGLNGVTNRIECAPPSHLDTALGQMVNFFGILQNEWAGAQAFSSFDTYLAPFVRHDKLDYKQTKQRIQCFLFNVGAPSRWGTQSPFTNLTFDWTVPEDLKDQPVIIGGKLQKTTYGDYQKEMDMINQAYIETATEGDNHGRVFTFPIPTYNITRDFNWDTANADLLFEMTAKYGMPYFQNFINSDLKPSDTRSMCCRLQMNLKDLAKKTGGLFGSGESTGSVGVVTINVARIGYLAKNKKDFFDQLEKLMDLAKESLEIKRKVVTHNLNNGLFPYTKRYLGNLDHHFSTIGPLGINEACLNFLGENITSDKGRKFALEILDFMRDELKNYQEETGNIYNLEAVPCEGTSYRLAKIDKKKYPKIITAGKNEPYYTNSSQLPVNYTDDIFEALDLQDELQCKYSGGCVEKGNRVLTDQGLLPIEYIVRNFKKLKPIKALSYNPKKKISEWDDVVKAVFVDVKKYNKIKIKGERNLDITTSDWHPFFVLEKIKINFICPICKKKIKNVKAFAAHSRYSPKCREKYHLFPKYQAIEKRADELEIGDYILQNFNNLYPKKKTELNNDLMWLIGFFIGDGCFSKFIDNRGGNKLERYKVRFFSEHQKALEKVAKILNKYFGCKVKIIRNDKRSKILKEVTSSKKEISEFFFKYDFQGGEKSYKIFVPQKIKENFTRTNIFSFLAGLMDSDGHIDKRDGNFEYYTVSSKLADDILEICILAGIMISKTKKRTKRANEVDIWRLRIPPYAIFKIKEHLTNTVHISRIKKKLSNRKKRHLPVVRVKSVSKVNVRDNQFYDLMTKKNHNYLAGKDCLVFIHNTVLHGFIGEKMPSIEATKNLVKKIAEKYHLPYFTITPTFSICSEHGYISGEHFKCPQCERDCEVYSRVVGYLRPVQQWNKGKQEEFGERKEFKIAF